jgi:hypothetical protein
MEHADLTNRFAYHPATTADRQQDHERIRYVCLLAAQHIDRLVPEGREKSLAVTKLEEAMMWANAGLARSGEPRPLATLEQTGVPR